MGCVIALLALSFPRIALLAIWLLGNGWLQESYHTALWPVLGFLLMPWTALAYAVAWHMGAGAIQGPGIILLIIAVLIDLGLLGGSARIRTRSSRTHRTG